jgi:hypothetical protein
MLPWGTPENIGSGGEVVLLCVVTKYLFCKYDFRSLGYSGGGFVLWRPDTYWDGEMATMHFFSRKIMLLQGVFYGFFLLLSYFLLGLEASSGE